jgi:hypothetical protein
MPGKVRNVSEEAFIVNIFSVYRKGHEKGAKI